ncbi:cell wall hydrolase [Phenylobacterium sp. LjRoot225]|uniref:cell wall hydrolase n=1 Tax=Phenylobacterium sp. LjRoot225 TaxID=3342285 RepID=UPI003ECD9666
MSLVAVLCVAFAVASGGALPAYAHLEDARTAKPVLVQPVSAPPMIVEAAPEAEPADAAVIRLQDMSPEAARLWNASNPLSTSPNPPAKPFKLAAEGMLDEARATDCMTAAIYYEAGYESADGQRAVAQVVLNRLRNPLFPKTVCGVVFQGSDRSTGCQFTFTCDGALARKPAEDAWERARKVAVAALNGYVMKKVGNATHYHANYVAPYWSPSLVKVGVVGQHIFYRWTGGLGRPPAFGGRYAGGEMTGLQIATLDNLSRGSAKLAATAQATVDAAAATPPQQVVALVEVAPAPKSQASAVNSTDQMVNASAVAQDAEALLKQSKAGWQRAGSPEGPPRIARPTADF